MQTLDLSDAKPLPAPPTPRVGWIRAFLINLERLQPPVTGHHSLTFGMVGNEKDGWLEQLVLTLRTSATRRGGNYTLDEFDLEPAAPSVAAERIFKTICRIQEEERKGKSQ